MKHSPLVSRISRNYALWVTQSINQWSHMRWNSLAFLLPSRKKRSELLWTSDLALVPISQVGLVVKNVSANAGDVNSIPGLGRSPGVGNGDPLLYSCLGNPMDRGAWQVTVHGTTESREQLNTHTYPYPTCRSSVKILSKRGILTQFSFLSVQKRLPQVYMVTVPCCSPVSVTLCRVQSHF